jgi:hypothetical protein
MKPHRPPPSAAEDYPVATTISERCCNPVAANTAGAVEVEQRGCESDRRPADE